MSEQGSKERYEELFSDESIKARAFDKIAKQYFYSNFGTMQKSDFDVLMFSLYIDRILETSESDMSTYSDYKLSKDLGITQSRVSALKEKKELKYPYPKFDWKKSFERIIENARYENGKIRIHIPDKNLYLELKNAVESNGGIIEVQLNSKVLQLSPEYFIDLMFAISDENDRKNMRKELKKKLDEKNIDTQYFDRKSIGDILKDNSMSVSADIVAGLINSCIPYAGPVISTIFKTMYKKISENLGGR